MHRLYSPLTNLYVDFDMRVLRSENFATRFETYEDASDAAIVMDAHGYTEVRIVNDDHRPRQESPYFRTYGEYQQAVWEEIRKGLDEGLLKTDPINVHEQRAAIDNCGGVRRKSEPPAGPRHGLVHSGR